MLTKLQLWQLKQFCKKYSLDYQEIDNTLTFSENKKHLGSLVPKRLEDRSAEAKAQEAEYMTEHFLSHYIICCIEKKNISKNVGEPIITAGEFSLKSFSMGCMLPTFFWTDSV